MRLLEARGTPYELGRSLGEQSGDLVTAAVDTVCRFDIEPGVLAAELEAVERRLAATFPDALEEARGVAEGAAIPVREVLSLSVCSELSGLLPGYCSLVAFPGASGTLVGKNLDSTRSLAPLQVVERLAPAGKLAFVHVTTAGAMWTDGGVNEAGLALANAAVEASAVDPEGVPDGIFARELLALCATVPEAVAFSARFSLRSYGENLLVADRDGRAAVIEKLPGGQAVREGPAVAACNHVLSPELAARTAGRDPIRANSKRRFARLESASRERRSWALDDVVALLTDPVGGVFQQGDSGLHTIASLVLAPSERRIWVSRNGTPLVGHPVHSEGIGSRMGPREEDEDGFAR